MAVSVAGSAEAVPGLPQALFDTGLSSPLLDEYAASPDGQRFLVLTRSVRLEVVHNWPALLD